MNAAQKAGDRPGSALFRKGSQCANSLRKSVPRKREWPSLTPASTRVKGAGCIAGGWVHCSEENSAMEVRVADRLRDPLQGGWVESSEDFSGFTDQRSRQHRYRNRAVGMHAESAISRRTVPELVANGYWWGDMVAPPRLPHNEQCPFSLTIRASCWMMYADGRGKDYYRDRMAGTRFRGAGHQTAEPKRLGSCKSKAR